MKDNQKVIAGVAVLALVAIFLIAGGPTGAEEAELPRAH